MTASLFVFILSFLISTILTYSVRFVATLKGWVDHPDNFRKLHPRPVPRLGGIGIFFGFVLPMVMLYLLKPDHVVLQRLLEISPQPLGVLAGGFLILVVGLIDDFHELKPLPKLIGQLLAALVAYYCGLAIRVISNPFGPSLHLGLWSLPVTVLWFLVCMNAVNLMDGLDGLAAGVCLFVSATLFLVSLHFLNIIGMVLMASLSGAIFGFLLFNFYPAKIFLGDSGSLLLGFLIASLSLIGTKRKAETAIALIIPIVAMGLPILDTTLSIIRRWYKRLPISSPDRQHIHHVLLAMGYSHRRAVLLLYALTLIFGAAALLITLERSEVTILTLGTLFLIAFISIRVFGGLRPTDLLLRLYTSHVERRSAATIRWIAERAIQKLGAAASLGALWESCTEAFHEMGLSRAELNLTDDAKAGVRTFVWQKDKTKETCFPEQVRDQWIAQFVLRTKDTPLATLTVCQDFSSFVPEVPAAIAALREALVLHLHRLLKGTGSASSPVEPKSTQTVAEDRPGTT